jgi:hypothetical protein
MGRGKGEEAEGIWGLKSEFEAYDENEYHSKC